MKTKKLFKVFLLTLSAAAVLILFVGFWYKQTDSIKHAGPQEINDPALGTKVLIATQGSDFKDRVLEGIVAKLKVRPVFIKVIDISDLKDIDPSKWTAIVIIHTWEMGASAVKEFTGRANSLQLIVLATSSDGGYHIDDIDGITSASLNTDVERCVTEIMNRIDRRLQLEEM